MANNAMTIDGGASQVRLRQAHAVLKRMHLFILRYVPVRTEQAANGVFCYIVTAPEGKMPTADENIIFIIGQGHIETQLMGQAR